MMEVVVTTGAISHAKLQSNHHHQQTPNFSQAGCPSCRPTNSVKALKGKASVLNMQPGKLYVTSGVGMGWVSSCLWYHGIGYPIVDGLYESK